MHTCIDIHIKIDKEFVNTYHVGIRESEFEESCEARVSRDLGESGRVLVDVASVAVCRDGGRVLVDCSNIDSDGSVVHTTLVALLHCLQDDLDRLRRGARDGGVGQLGYHTLVLLAGAYLLCPGSEIASGVLAWGHCRR